MTIPADRKTKDLLPEQAVRFLRQESTRLCGSIKVPRPWHYAELHNPWARAASFYDSWGFLDLCQSPPLVDSVAKLIGGHIILFDSQWLPDPWQPPVTEFALESDAHRFAVDPPRGVTALIAFGEPAVTVHLSGPVSLELEPGNILLVDFLTSYCVDSCGQEGLPTVYAVRYFPASSRYLRDPSAPVHRALTDRYPLFNYAQMPLWLVRGEDQARNDFVTGFNARAGFWTSANW
jgi:hypothetical protein